MSSKNIAKEINNILLNIWDPIGIKSIPEAYDEYRFYVETVQNILLESKDPKSELTNYLYYIEKDMIGLQPNEENLKIVVELLIKLL